MKRGIPLLFLTFLLLAQPLKGQLGNAKYAPLSQYDFEEETYSLLFASVRDDAAFLVNGTASLQQLQRTWIFDKKAVTYPIACNDGFQVLLLHQNKVVDRFSIRMRCEAFVAGKDWWHLPMFSPALIPEAQPLIKKDSIYVNLAQARKALRALRKNEKVVFIEPPSWENFEGYFHFNVPNPNHSGKAPATPWPQLQAKVEQELSAAYPGQSYMVKLDRHGYGEHYPTVSFRLTANKSLFDQFSLYPISAWGWRPLPLKQRYHIKP